MQALDVLLEIAVGLAQPDLAVKVTFFLHIGPGLGVVIRAAHGDPELLHNGISGAELGKDVAAQNGADQVEHGGGIHVGVDILHGVADQVDDIGVSLQYLLQELVQQVAGAGC